MVNKYLKFPYPEIKEYIQSKNYVDLNEWLIEFFNNNRETLNHEHCISLVHNSDQDQFYMLAINGNDYDELNFVINYCGVEDVEFLNLDENPGTPNYATLFFRGLNKLTELIDQL